MNEKIPMPKELTAENGAKYALSGEFKVNQLMRCDYEECEDGINNGDVCEACDGAGEYTLAVTVPWDIIKDIYAKAVSLFSEPDDSDFITKTVDIPKEHEEAFDHYVKGLMG